MNTDDQRLAQLLHDRADRQPTTPVQLGEVTRRAGVIRRRRRTAAAAAVAAVVAVIAVPTALVLGGEPDAAPPPSHQGTPTPTPKPSPSESTEPASTLVLSSVGQGAAPAIPYVTGHTIHLEGGRTVTLPSTFGRVVSVAAYHGGWLVADSGRGGQTDNTGKVVRTGVSDLVTSADGTQIAYSGAGGVRVGTQMGQGEQVFGLANPGHIVGFLSGGRVVYDAGAGQRSVYVMGSGSQAPLAELWAASDANEGTDLVAGSLGDNEAGVVSATTGKRLWHAPDRQLQAFSPDGRYVSSMTYADRGWADVTILDARTGRFVTSFRLTSHGLQILSPPVWESDSSLLFAVQSMSSNQEAVLRLTASGTLDRATPLRRSPANHSDYAFAARR